MDIETIKVVGKWVILAILLICGFVMDLKNKDSDGYFFIALIWALYCLNA